MNTNEVIIMKKGIFVILLVLLCASLSWGYYVKDFNSTVTVFTNARIKVVERIVVDFEDELHHGIYRDITYKFKTKHGNKYNIRLKIASVTNGSGAPRKYKMMKHGKDIRVRIGNPNRTISGVQEYVITYFVDRAITFFDDHDELWWEVTGLKWECPIQSASATVMLPSKTDLDKVDATCYTGKYGSTAQDCQWTLVPGGVAFKSGYIASGEGLSVVVGIPKNIIKKPSSLASIMWFLKDNWIWILCFPIPFIVFLFLFLKWFRYGRDPMHGTSIMVRYEPPEDLSPAEMGTVVDEKADISDITATIVDLAVRGFLKLVETKTEKLLFFKKTDYAIVRLPKYFEDSGKLSAFEQRFINNLFSVGEDLGKTPADLGVPEGKDLIFISTLKDKFYTKLQNLKKTLYSNLTKRGYFPQNPETVRGKYSGIGVVLIFLGFFIPIFLSAFLFSSGWAIAWAFIPSGILYYLFAPIMPRKTRKGAAAAIHTKGFEEFVRRAEKDRIKKLAHDDPTIFERLLPYAMVLGCADEWVEKFKDIFKEQPDWFVGPQPLMGYLFIDSLGRAMNSMGNSISSRPRSSGASGGGSGFSGGFSGGGFGGGGGGAW